jgi:Tfp pilus assembly protein PilX
MTGRRPRGTTLVVGLVLLTVVTLLGLAGATGAHIEQQLARNEQFRENAASAASAGIEYAISRIVSSPLPDTDAAPSLARETLRDSTDRFETVTRFVGFESALPQAASASLAGAHFEVTSTGYSAGGAVDRQRAGVMLVVPAPFPAAAPECAPAAGIPCFQSGELVRLSWQRVPSS